MVAKLGPLESRTKNIYYSRFFMLILLSIGVKI